MPEGADEDEEEGEEGAAPPPPPEPVERMGLAVSVLHLPPGSSVHAAFVEEGLPGEGHGQMGEGTELSGLRCAPGVLPLPSPRTDCSLLPPACLLPLPSLADPSTLPGAWGLRDGELPQGGSLFPRTWLVFSDRHSHVDGVLAEVGGRVGCNGLLGSRGCVGHRASLAD